MAQYQPERSTDDHIVEKGLDEKHSADHSHLAEQQDQIPPSYGAAGAGVEQEVPKKKGVIQMLKEKLTGNKHHEDPVAPNADEVVKHDHPHHDAKVGGMDKMEDAVTGQKPGHVSASERIARDGFGNPVEEGNAVSGREALNSDSAGVNTPVSTVMDVKDDELAHGLGGATNAVQSTPDQLLHQDNRDDLGSQLRAHPQKNDADYGEDSFKAVADGSSGVLNQNVNNENLGYGDREADKFPEKHHHLGTDGEASAVSSVSPTHVAGAAFPHQSHDISDRDPQSAYGVASGTPESNTSLDVLPTKRADAEVIDGQEYPSSVPHEGISTDHHMHQADSYHSPQSSDQRASANAPDRSESNSLISQGIKSSDPANVFHSGDRKSVHQSASAHATDSSLATREPESEYSSSLQGTSQASYNDATEVDHGHDFGSGTAAPVDQISAHDQFLNNLTQGTAAERNNYPRQYEQVNRMHNTAEPFGNDSQQGKQIDQTDQLHQLNPSQTTQVSNYAQHHPSINPLNRPKEENSSPEYSSVIPQDQSQELSPSYAAPVNNSAQQDSSMLPQDQSQKLNSSRVAPVSDYAQQHPSMMDQSQQSSHSAPGSNYDQQHPSIEPLDQTAQKMSPSDATPVLSNSAQQYPSQKSLDQPVQKLNSSHLVPDSNYAQQQASVESLDQSQQMTPTQADPESNYAQQHPSRKPLDQPQQSNGSHEARVSNYDQQHPSTKSLDQSEQLKPSYAAQRSPHQHHHINEHDRPQELNSTPGQMNTSSTASADLQTDLTPGRSGSTEPATSASKINSHNTNINSSNTSKATGQHGWPLPVHPSQIGAVHTDTEGKVVEGTRDDDVKKGGFMSKMKNKLHLGHSTDHESRT